MHFHVSAYNALQIEFKVFFFIIFVFETVNQTVHDSLYLISLNFTSRYFLMKMIQWECSTHDQMQIVVSIYFDLKFDYFEKEAHKVV